jgi:FtsP/CotA-like multicopper oxidase with cupredoxin domain
VNCQDKEKREGLEMAETACLAGERVDFVLTADQPAATYWLHVTSGEDCESLALQGAAILRYEGAPEGSGPAVPAAPNLDPESSSLTVSLSL